MTNATNFTSPTTNRTGYGKQRSHLLTAIILQDGGGIALQDSAANIISGLSSINPETNFSAAAKNRTNFSSSAKNRTNYSKSSVNPTNYS